LEASEIRLRFKDGCDFKSVGANILKALNKRLSELSYAKAAPDNYEGCRICYDEKHGDGWALVRMSLHEPILPINVESNVKGGSLKIVKDLYYYLERYDCLDLTPLENAVRLEREKLFNSVKSNKEQSSLDFIFH
jgi:phosphomannomutase